MEEDISPTEMWSRVETGYCQVLVGSRCIMPLTIRFMSSVSRADSERGLLHLIPTRYKSPAQIHRTTLERSSAAAAAQ